MIQALISDYETGKLRPYADVVARFAQALSVSADELLGIAPPPKTTTSSDENPASRRFMRRAKLMTKLPKRDQDALLRTIDAVLKQIKETS